MRISDGTKSTDKLKRNVKLEVNRHTPLCPLPSSRAVVIQCLTFVSFSIPIYTTAMYTNRANVVRHTHFVMEAFAPAFGMYIEWFVRYVFERCRR